MSKQQIPGFNTANLHADRQGKPEHGVLHKPVHTSVAFEYDDARELAAVFQGKKGGYNYGRQQNPTVNALQDRITKMEGGVASVAFATGMAAIGSLLFSLLKSGDHLISSSYLFGNTNSLLNTFTRFGIEVTFVDSTDVNQVAEAIRPNTKLVFTETIANPVTQIADLSGIGKLCAEHNLVYVVDNTMTSPWLFQPITVGANFVVNSMTKYIGGHGNALGGVLTDAGTFDWSTFDNILDTYKNGDAASWGLTQIRKKGLRDFGATLGPEAAHHLAVGSETLSLRMDRACSNAQQLADFFESHVGIANVNYPGLPSHPQHQRALALFRHPGALMSIDLDASIDCFDFLNRLNHVVSSSNLGDTRTLAIPVAHTIFYEMGPERRASMGVSDNLIRLSVGIEDIDDLLADFDQALRT
jgi:O-acetylhomoserine (thiol)-lyase